MKAAPFTYLRADTVDETCAALSRHGEEARILAGGQSLGAMLNMRLVTPSVVVDINRIPGLDRIEQRGDHVVTGALVRQADALADAALCKAVPLLALALPHVGHFQTRSRGTLAGSAAHADPSAEVPLILTALNGEIELRSARRSRRVKARTFFTSALTTIRVPDEMIVALHWPVARPGTHYGFREFSLRAGDYAVVAAAGAARFGADGALEDLSLAFAGCADRPQLLAGNFKGQRPAEIAAEAARQIECKGDLHATAAYRRQLVRIFAEEILNDMSAVHA